MKTKKHSLIETFAAFKALNVSESATVFGGRPVNDSEKEKPTQGDTVGKTECDPDTQCVSDPDSIPQLPPPILPRG